MSRDLQRQLDAFEAHYDYSMDYARAVVAVDPELYSRFYQATQLSSYSGGLPPAAHFAVKILGVMSGDCGPCVQLGVKMAEEAGVDASILRATLQGDLAALPEDVRDCVSFARALLRRDAELEELRDRVIARFGPPGVIAIAYCLITSFMYPTLKYALGHGQGCTRVLVGETPLAVNPA